MANHMISLITSSTTDPCFYCYCYSVGSLTMSMIHTLEWLWKYT